MSSPRLKIVAGNWKMYKTYEEGLTLAEEVLNCVQEDGPMVLIGAPFIHLVGLQPLVSGSSNVAIAAQNCHFEQQGAYTGEVSPAMLRSIGVDYVILGHSERREYFGEDDALIAKKIDAAMSQGLSPIYCCGEKLEIRDSGKHLALVEDQLKTALFHLSREQMQQVVIAYEPVWAIGTGRTASPEQAQEMHAFIRGLIAKQFGSDTADAVTILYGGSVKPNNAAELFGMPDVDGGLVGGASLVAADFLSIINSIA